MIYRWFFTDSFIVSAAGSEAIALIKYACIPGFLNMKGLKRNTTPLSAFGLTPVPDLGLISGGVFIVCHSAHVQMPPECPECGSAKVAEIVYGYPSSDWDWEKDVDSGKVVLGGCCIPPDPHSWQCQSCDHEWGEAKGLD